jgi:arylsulfatase A-like enzyme
MMPRHSASVRSRKTFGICCASSGPRRGIIAAYYTSVEFLDRNVGRLLAKLHDLELDRDTLVVYTADHGYCLGHHGRFEKHCGYDPALRVPLLMRWPGHVPQNVEHDLTQHLALKDTITRTLGITRGRGGLSTTGAVFSEYLENEEAHLRSKIWKLVYCSGRRARRDGYETDDPTPGRYVRLFDLREDPDELTNVARQRLEIVTSYQEVMLAFFRNSHPDARHEPRRMSTEQLLDWYLRPRDV